MGHDPINSDDQRYVRARHRVRALRGFYIHLLIFVAIMPFLLIVNVGTGTPWWVQWPFLGWGVAVLVHAVVVFGLVGWLGPEWEEKKIRELMSKN